jgi:hypothetical protein
VVSLDLLAAAEIADIDRSLKAMAALVLEASSLRARRSGPDGNRFSYHVSPHLPALVSIA